MAYPAHARTCRIMIICTVMVWGLMPGHALPTFAFPVPSQPGAKLLGHEMLLISLGDSMTQGTMNATNNLTNASHAYIHKIYESLGQVGTVGFVLPQLNTREQRTNIADIPTNLAVDGTDIFSLTGLRYYKRTGEQQSLPSRAYLCDRLLPWRLNDLTDRVLYPINLLAGGPVSQLDAALWWLTSLEKTPEPPRPVIVFWVGNNDSSDASLGFGGSRPTFVPVPFDLVGPEMKPLLRHIMTISNRQGLVSFEPYLLSSITGRLTETDDFAQQFSSALERIVNGAEQLAQPADIFVCTLPYYSSVGFLMDSDDLEFFLRQVDSAYAVPSSFRRVAEPGVPITDYARGDRISLITFMSMYVLLSQGHAVEEVNRTLETGGLQRDGLVLSEEEQTVIMERIDSYNAVIAEAVNGSGPRVHLIDTGGYLNDVLTGRTTVMVAEKQLTRQWGRGSGFTLDGVHPGYTAHAFIANFILEHINDALGTTAPQHDLPAELQQDPYIDADGDGWVPGPGYTAAGVTELLLLFRDPDDSDPDVHPALPPDIWDRISDILLEEFLF